MDDADAIEPTDEASDATVDSQSGPPKSRPWWPWVAGIAAAFLLGLGIGVVASSNEKSHGQLERELAATTRQRDAAQARLEDRAAHRRALAAAQAARAAKNQKAVKARKAAAAEAKEKRQAAAAKARKVRQAAAAKARKIRQAEVAKAREERKAAAKAAAEKAAADRKAAQPGG